MSTDYNPNPTTLLATDAQNISATVQISLPSDDSLKQNNAGQNNNQTSNLLTSNQSTDIIASAGTIVSTASKSYNMTSVGNAALAGGVSSSNSDLPNIYLSFKRYTYSNQNVVFRFTTDSLSSLGATTNSWSSDSSIYSGLTLTNPDSNCLTTVSAYDKYFYQLANNSYIGNQSLSLRPSFSPSYTVFVFGLGAQTSYNTSSGFKNLIYSSKFHRFVASNSYYANQDVYNFGVDQDSKLKSVFTGSTLNSEQFLMTNGKLNYKYFKYNNPNVVFLNNYYDFYNSDGHLGWDSAVDTNYIKYFDLNLFNLKFLPTSLANPSTAVPFSINNGTTTTQYNTFMLFFVEMLSYVSTNKTDNSFNDLIFETYINGKQTYKGIQALRKDVSLPATANYSMRLSNYNSSSTNMFLFDYINGNSTTTQQLPLDARNITKSLAYKYRNLLLKSQTDLQISNSTKSILFPPTPAHPFLNMYLNVKN